MSKNGPLKRRASTEKAPNKKQKAPPSPMKKDPFSMVKANTKKR